MLCETSEQKNMQNATEQSWEHGHGDDIVPGQLMDNCSIESSKLKHSDGGINKSPDNITDGCTEVPNISKLEQLGPLPDDKSKSTARHYQIVLALKYVADGCAGKQTGARHITSYQKSGRNYRKTQAEGSNCSGGKRGRKKGQKNRIHDKTPTTREESECSLRSSTDRRRGRSSNIQDTPAASEPDSNMENATSVRKRGRKKGQRNSNIHDEFSRMRVHLRYLLHKIRYEQNLLDAYSSEGWRGQSLEKLRPEKELERAKLTINRIKLKIRDLFQRLDAVCAEGQFPESLFDSEGLVDSEDIFCAKCGHKDLSPNNDIILCDGACDRGFHQKCLDPPLRTEEIPPGDEGWFCPACDCRFDCVELVNDSMGTQLSISHSYEKVFPEATAKPGSAHDDTAGLPSDDSEDNDYNPEGADDDNMEEGGESSSDESDFSSASEDLGAIHNTDDQYLGLPSDDPDDDDFDPNCEDAEDQPKKESSSSDFSSASEDLNATIENNEISSQEEHQDSDDSAPITARRQPEKLDYKKLYDETYGNATSESSDDEEWDDAVTPEKRKNDNSTSHSSEGEECRVTTKRRYSSRNASSRTKTNGIPAAAVQLNTSTTGRSPLTPKAKVSNDSQNPETSTGLKRNKRQPDEKLGEEAIQETYGNATTDSNEDEEWDNAVTPKKRKNGGKNILHSSEGEEGRVTSKRRYSSRNASSGTKTNGVSAAVGGLNTSTPGKSPSTPKAKVSNDSRNPETSTGLKRNKRQPYVVLGEEVIQKLNAAFEENQYPDRSTKDKLAGELGLTLAKVSRWFETNRWKINHSAGGDANTSRVASRGRKKARPSSAGAS